MGLKCTNCGSGAPDGATSCQNCGHGNFATTPSLPERDDHDALLPSAPKRPLKDASENAGEKADKT